MDFEYNFPPDFPLDVLVIMLIQVEKGTTSKLLLQACLDFISQQQRFAIYKSPIGTYQILIRATGGGKMNDNRKLSYIWNCEALVRSVDHHLGRTC